MPDPSASPPLVVASPISDLLFPITLAARPAASPGTRWPWPPASPRWTAARRPLRCPCYASCMAKSSPQPMSRGNPEDVRRMVTGWQLVERQEREERRQAGPDSAAAIRGLWS